MPLLLSLKDRSNKAIHTHSVPNKLVQHPIPFLFSAADLAGGVGATGSRPLLLEHFSEKVPLN